MISPTGATGLPKHFPVEIPLGFLIFDDFQFLLFRGGCR
jgi:hypothetical protein